MIEPVARLRRAQQPRAHATTLDDPAIGRLAGPGRARRYRVGGPDGDVGGGQVDRAPAAGGRERGSVALETVIVFPVVMVLIWGALQVGFWAYGRNVCQATAEQAAAAGATFGSSAAVALQAGRAFADATGHGLLENTTVHVERTATQITVVVEADVLAVAPGFPHHINQVATLPVERPT